MRKSLFILFLLLLTIFFGCSDISSGRSDAEDQPVAVETVARGEILLQGEAVDIEYTVNDTEVVIDRLAVTVTGENGNVVYENTLEEQPLAEWVPSIDPDEPFQNGYYVLRLDFYSGDELFFSESREFFVSSSNLGINSITSYPPVLYPGGGGLFYADTECESSDCWLRWMLDGEVIAEGAISDGYHSIEIEAPETEGVYNLSLELFPSAPAEKDGFSFESELKKVVPLYINREQKSGVNEFAPEDNFISLYHFRGSYIDSVAGETEEKDELQAAGNPELAVRNGIFGYHLDGAAGFTVDELMVPLDDGLIKDFSIMISLVAENLPVSGSEEIFFTGTEDGDLSVAAYVLPDGRMKAETVFGGYSFTHLSDAPLLKPDRYASVSLTVSPGPERLSLAWYLDGEPESEKIYLPQADEEVFWLELFNESAAASARIFGGGSLSGLIDEFGVYLGAIDPAQYERAMELKYGKSLIYAEGFDGEAEELGFSSEDVYTSGSSLFIGPGSSVDFPPIYPGYEEVLFRIGVASSGSGGAEAVFYVDGESSSITRVDMTPELEEGDVSFSLIFSSDSIAVDGIEGRGGTTEFADDFSGIGYQIINNDAEKFLEIESILIIRKNIGIAGPGINIPKGKNISS